MFTYIEAAPKPWELIIAEIAEFAAQHFQEEAQHSRY